ncbi:complex III assembly factor LYRM7 [Gouania willdenowi]|uniref:Complex III assembly factor LYRM7 n=1 Tax=Gouania willdenowi TaxID=441366 RepID=A0A8C5HC24_GOUWI|nr:complex III assembly factor LYRM7 [Gouania willdenowi]
MTHFTQEARKGKMETRLKVLRVFKTLHRTRMEVFKEDDRALTAARLKINEEFRKNKDEKAEENIQKMIKMGSDVEIVLRQNVLQMEHVGEETLMLRPREDLLLENVPYCDQPRDKS